MIQREATLTDCMALYGIGHKLFQKESKTTENRFLF